MAATVGSINVLFTVNYNGYQQGVTRAADVTETQGRRITKAVANVDRATSQLNRSIGSIRSREFRVLSLAALRTKDSVERLRSSMVAVTALAGGFGAAFTAKGLMDYSDTYKQVGNRLRTVKMEAQELAHLEQTIYETAQKSRSTYESTGVLFSRIAGASRRLAISQKDVLRVTETIQKAFVVGGSTPIEATQSAIQLSQGIASNRLQGDELRSVLENPALGQLLADKISGGDLGALRKMAADGELTASVIIKAFKEASKEIDRLFANTEQTIGQAFNAVDNAILRYVGTSDLAKTASAGLVGVLNALAQNFNGIGDGALVLGGSLLGLIGARGFGGVADAMVKSSKETLTANRSARSLAASNVIAANSEYLLARQHKKSAQAAYDMAKAGQVSASTRLRLGRELQAAYYAEAVASKAAAAAGAAHRQVLAATTLRANAAALAMRGFSASLAFVGGPFGLALLAVGAAMTVMSVRAQAAEEQAERYSAAIKVAGTESFRAAEKIRAAAAEMAQPKEGDNITVLQDKLNTAKKDLADFYRKISDIATEVNFDPLLIKIEEIGKKFKEKEISLQDFLNETYKLTKENPGRAGIIQYFQDAARMADAARGTIDTLSKSVDKLDGKEANVTIVVKQKVQGGSAFGKPNLENALDGENLKHRMAEDQDDTFIGKLLKEGDNAAKSARSEAAEARRAAADERQRLKDDAKKANDKEISSDIEKYIEGIEGLKNTGIDIFMSDMDQKIIATARSFGLAELEIRRFIEATKAGETVPAQFQAIAYELERIAENEKIKEFIDGAADAFGNLFQSIMDGSMSTSEALKRFGMDILKMAQQIYVVEPAMRMFRNFFSGFGGMGGGFTGQGGFGTATDIWAGLRVPSAHDGWTVGSGKAPGSKVVSPLAFAGAKKFHGGLGNDEFAAILEKGERVLTEDQAGAAMNVIAGAAGGGGGGNTVVNVYNNSGAPVSEKRRKSDGVDIVDIVVGAFNQGASMGKVDSVMGDRYGAKKRRRAR